MTITTEQKSMVMRYEDGQEVPAGAIYLCTKTETESRNTANGAVITLNVLVWHYFRVAMDDTNE